MKKILVIGGTGIVGIPLVERLLVETDIVVHSIALERSGISSERLIEHIVDRNTEEFETLFTKLRAHSDSFQAVVDVFSFSVEHSRKLLTLLGSSARQYLIFSTTLVYDRQSKRMGSIPEDAPLIPKGVYGGYVDGKLDLERFWQSQSDVHWTILRPYHILGKQSLLGCLPIHNRDPYLIRRIQNGERLNLYRGGAVSFNYIHPVDIAETVFRLIGNENSYQKVYNLVNPDLVTAKQYYEEVGRQIGKEVHVHEISAREFWSKKLGWGMTTFPHAYDVSPLIRDTTFTPSIPLKIAVADALATAPVFDCSVENIPIHRRMNKPPLPIPPSWLLQDEV